MPTAQLIALDWGSSSLRAYLMDGAGQVVQERSSDAGASRLSGDRRPHSGVQHAHDR